MTKAAFFSVLFVILYMICCRIWLIQVFPMYPPLRSAHSARKPTRPASQDVSKPRRTVSSITARNLQTAYCITQWFDWLYTEFKFGSRFNIWLWLLAYCVKAVRLIYELSKFLSVVLIIFSISSLIQLR